MFEDVIFHAGIGQRTGGIDTHGFQLSRDQLHRCDAAIADPCGERFAVDEGSALTPKAKPGRIGQIVAVGSTSGGRVNDTGPRHPVLELNSCNALLLSRRGAAPPFPTSTASHAVPFAQPDQAVEFFPAPTP